MKLKLDIFQSNTAVKMSFQLRVDTLKAVLVTLPKLLIKHTADNYFIVIQSKYLIKMYSDIISIPTFSYSMHLQLTLEHFSEPYPKSFLTCESVFLYLQLPQFL